MPWIDGGLTHIGFLRSSPLLRRTEKDRRNDREDERGEEQRKDTLLSCEGSVLLARAACYRVYCGVRRERGRKRASGKRRSAEKDKRNSTYLAYFSAYVLPELVETSRQGHLVTASHSILARQFVHRVPDVIALEQISNSIIPTLRYFSFSIPPPPSLHFFILNIVVLKR